MPNPIIKIVNSETGEEVERQMTAAEKADYEAAISETIARNEAIKAELGA